MENLIVKSLKEKEANLLVQLDVIRGMIDDELRKYSKESTPVNTVSQPNRLPKKSTVVENESVLKKFLRVLKENQRFMKVREVAQVIVESEGGDENDWVTKLSRRTKKLKDLGKIVKYQVGASRTNIYWGSPNWIKNGHIKSGFEINPDSINKKGANPLSDYDL